MGYTKPETRRAYCEKNRARINKQMREWRKQNPEKAKANERQTYLNCKEKRLARSADWFAQNRERDKETRILYNDRHRGRRLLAISLGLRLRDIPEGLAAAKDAQIAVRRLLLGRA